MGLKCGIVGLPNVGKSTLHNALTATHSAKSANYPFCTVEPNSGIVEVPDDRLNILSKIANSETIIPTFIEFVDIAGLVKGASEGEGLGNKFLSHIREVDAIIHVVRCFEDDDITHVCGNVDPIRDLEIINTELILSDLECVDRKISNIEKKYKNGDKTLKMQLDHLNQIKKHLADGAPARSYFVNFDNQDKIIEINLLTAKPVLYVCNVLEKDVISGNEYVEKVQEVANLENSEMVFISSQIEAEISNLSTKAEQQDFLNYLGVQSSGLEKIIQSSYKLLKLNSYFTVGKQETRAWTFKSGTLAPQAAGIIHSDFEKGFIRAEVISFEDYVLYQGENGSKEKGAMKLQGKDYVVRDGDVIHFRFNV